MADSTRLERLDKGLSIFTKLGLWAVAAWLLLALSFCSDDSLRGARKWADDRLRVMGIQITEAQIAGAKINLAATAALGIDADAAQGLVQDLRAILADVGSPGAVPRLAAATAQLDSFAAKLQARDERVIDAIRTTAKPLPAQSGPVTAWVYLGRKSEDGAWSPLSDRVALSKNGDTWLLSARKDVVLVDRNPADAETDAPPAADESVRIVRPGTTNLDVKKVVETPSIGKGRLVWGQVSVAADRVSESRLR